MHLYKARFFIALFFCSLAHAEQFKFVAYGDMPYSIPEDFIRYERLIKKINRENPSFSIFVGDTKSSKTPCTDDYNQKILDYFNQFEMPLIYSVGDNEWTDCHRPLSGSYNSLERLKNLRTDFFGTNHSFGKKTILLHRQADIMSQFSAYVENSYWLQSNFLFASLHIPGSNNNFRRDVQNDREYLNRNKANLAWIDYVFTLAKKENYSGVVLAYQADMFFAPKQATEATSGYREIINSLVVHAEEWNLPVLLINGDSHRLKIDQPLNRANKIYVLENVTRLQVMGDDQVQAVEVIVDSASNQPFSFKPILVNENSLR